MATVSVCVADGRSLAAATRSRCGDWGFGDVDVDGDADRDAWRTFRLDRIEGRARLEGRGRRRAIPGGDPAAFLAGRLRGGESSAELRGRIRVARPAAQIAPRVPHRYATVESDGEPASIVSTRGGWSPSFVVWTALLEEPLSVLGPPELQDAARMLAARLGEVAAAAR
jgi:hypothetical protein